MRLDRDVLEVILRANRISAEKEHAKLESQKASSKETAAKILVCDAIKQRLKDILSTNSLLVRGGYCAPALRDRAIANTVNYLNARGQHTAVFPYQFIARRVTVDLGFTGPDATKRLAELVSEKLSALGYPQLKARTRHRDENVYIVTT